MKIVPNIGQPMRVGYVVIGLVLIVAPFAMALQGWERVILPVLGGVSIGTGAVGW